MSPCFLPMADILETIIKFLDPLLEGTDIFLVNAKVKPVNNVKVYLDADNGLSIEKSARVNRQLRTLIEEHQMFPDGNYSLEVSSPGVDEPLLTPRQYAKNIGRTVLITLADDTEKLGVLKEINEVNMVLELKVPKKKEKETIVTEIPLADIKKTVVQIIF